ncbi:AI-2E family transporter [Clostridium swellfunianum]|uniref:AI-2E family transporter n=1 Tax=Clostridium swellfunianum TaxID=1367462 RepID=UPI00202FB364|nr:AI-2E family transporter [Clostridium swellfunianum]MCM0647925.1 AI-2E family transporter [Clostridium swellfunianum]
MIGSILLGRIVLIHRLTTAVTKTLLVPLFISTLFFYIIRPLNNIFIKKGLGTGKGSLLSLLISGFILSGLVYYFSQYAYGQFKDLRNNLTITVKQNSDIKGIISYLNQFINSNQFYALAVDMTKNYIQKIGQNFMRMAGYFMNTFSMVFLIIVIVFYMLKDGHKFKKKTLRFVPEKYKSVADKLLSESDVILSHYVTGQAKVALSLSLMIFTGYKIIGMPNAMILSTITFILAFIPFVGFFISMIIPVVIALGMGILMFAKLVVVFIIVQTLKGRVVVPAIMARSMKIHPLTDIFLVIAAIAAGGPFAAFAVVPIYAIIKNAVIIIRENKQMFEK